MKLSGLEGSHPPASPERVERRSLSMAALRSRAAVEDRKSVV